MTSIAKTKSPALPAPRPKIEAEGAQRQAEAKQVEKDPGTTTVLAQVTRTASSPASSDQYSASNAMRAELPSGALQGGQSSTSSPLGSFVARLAQGRQGLANDLQALENKLHVAAQALPSLAQADALTALKTSAERILPALDTGRISPTEAEQAVHMLGEMIGALIAIEQGQYSVSLSTESGAPDFVAYDVSTTDGDMIRVGARRAGSQEGQARLKFYNIVDDGEVVGKAQRIMIRFDLEGSELEQADLHAAVDVQFGSEKPASGSERLDNRIHGVLLDENGSPVLNRGGHGVADHHFKLGFTQSESTQKAFAEFIDSFVGNLEAQRAAHSSSANTQVSP